MSETVGLLFVDDEQDLLRGLQRSLGSMRRAWNMVFVGSGAEALDVLGQQAIDVLVTDMRMPGMDGATLMARVKERYPGIARIVLSGYSDKERLLQTTGIAHRFLSKPCPVDVLKETINRAITIRRLLADESLRQFISGIGALPSLPSLYTEIVEVLRSDKASVRTIGEIIAKDVAMTAKLLQLSNSAFFGPKSRTADPADAVSLLGVETVKALVLSMHLFAQFSQEAMQRFEIELLWQRAVAVSKLAKQIAVREKASAEMVADATVAGLLHDVGKLIFIQMLPERYEQAATQALEMDAERQLLGASHGEVGAYLLGLWGIPDAIIEAVAFHHDPERLAASGFTPLTAVHVAVAIVHAMDGVGTDESAWGPNLAYLERLGLADRYDEWRAQLQPVGGSDVT